VQGRYTAREDLTLRQVIFTSAPSGIIGSVGRSVQIVSTDPDFTLLNPGQVGEEFQLISVNEWPIPTDDPFNFWGHSARTMFQNLSFPLLKGQTLYWAGNGPSDLVQLIFS
jgi:hypothetical protein